MIRVLVADDHAVVRDGLEQLVRSADDLEFVGGAGDGGEAVDRGVELEPDVVLMDLSMPGLDGIEATRRLVKRVPGVQVVVLTSFSDRGRILGALDAGAVGYLLKDATPEELLERDPRGRARRVAARAEGRARAPGRPRRAGAGAVARTRAGDPRARRGGAPEQDHRAAPRDQREDGQVAPDERLPADRRDRSRAGGALGARPRHRLGVLTAES